MEFFRAALYDCIVDDDNLTYEHIDQYRYMVEMNIVEADDDLKKLMSIAFEWLDDPVRRPFHVYMLWQACRALLMNGFTEVTDRQVTAIFKEHPREFAKCFSDDEDIDNLMLVYGTENDEPDVWNMYIVKVRKLGNKLLKIAEGKKIEFSHAKYNPNCVPYGLTELIASREDATDVDPQDDFEQNYEELMFKYDATTDLFSNLDKERRVWEASELSMKLSVDITVKYKTGEIHKSMVTGTVTSDDYDSFHRDAKEELGYMIKTNM